MDWCLPAKWFFLHFFISFCSYHLSFLCFLSLTSQTWQLCALDSAAGPQLECRLLNPTYKGILLIGSSV
ncbi:hypothetical protein PISMIDRAFT_450662 [Pisolithus microcarpus 441]|uniref:Uncharacterized protein n=1 Tax=Pisolithus microcarpus 441 TaxID=765257 RepID=A0A0C9ZMN0_9AGAM|nr:hypothetical protein PISMIDRAFT_450662 [Pisolithus microcarpus 441]